MSTTNDGTQYADEGEPSELGEQLPNFYSLENMTAAYNKLMAETEREGNRSMYPVNIRATHKYIKFTPQNEEEVEILRTSDLALFDVPLDREEIVVGKFYHDPSVPEDMPTPQYTTVKNDVVLPNVAYEVLANVYIPEEDMTLLGESFENYKFVYSLVQTAQRLSGFIHPEECDLNPWDNLTEPGTWYPPGGGSGGGGGTTVDGTIRIFDTRLNQWIGLEGVKIKAKRFLKVRSGITNANGQYSLDGIPFQYNKKVDYKLFMDRANFIIKEALMIPSVIKRNNILYNHWSYDFALGYENMQGHMFRAAFRYFYKDIDGLKRPRQTGSSSVIAKNEWMGWAGHNNGFFDIIRVGRYKSSSNDEYDTDEIFGITIHELAHLSHHKAMNGGLQYTQVSDIICESWAIAIQWQLTNKEYRERGITGTTPADNYGDVEYFVSGLRRPHNYAYQYWSKSTSAEYTTLFINLMDNYNELGQWFSGEGRSGTVNDQVQGYTLGNIETNMLSSIYGLSSLGTHLKTNKPAGVTDAQIDLLLSFY